MQIRLSAWRSTSWYSLLAKEFGMKLSARNALKCRVKQVKHGAVNSEIVLEVANPVEVVSIITKESAETLGLSQGKNVYAIIKASNVMVGVD